MISSDFNYFASKLARDLNGIQKLKEMHIGKLTTGKKVRKPADDAGALATSMKFGSELKRIRGVGQTLQNALSYTQMQESALTSVNRLYQRMAQLATMALDSTKNDSDRENYDKEFQELRSQTLQIDLSKFNDQDLFRNTKYSVTLTGRISWLDARQHAAAASASDSEYEHYMATITSQDEQDEIQRQLDGDANGLALWLGGADGDGAEEGKWRWVEGPEGKEEGGLGRQFWDIATDSRGEVGESGVNNSYLNWNGGEPNNSGGNEDALQILQTNGLWNDLPDTNTGPRGYLRESDPINLKVMDDAHGGHFELNKISFKRFLESTTIDLTNLANAKDALDRVLVAQEDVVDKIALAGSNASRLASEIVALEENFAGKERSLGRIDDLDIARSASSLAKVEIKMQAATSILAQANSLFAQRNYVQDLL